MDNCELESLAALDQKLPLNSTYKIKESDPIDSGFIQNKLPLT